VGSFPLVVLKINPVGGFPPIGVVASLVLWVEELRKLVVRRRRRLLVDGASDG
jgi:hypothetical protein